MNIIRILSSFLLLFGLLILCSGTTQSQTRLRAVSTGSWGGPGVGMTVEKGSVKIEYDCAEGEIPRQLKVDKKGRFNVVGTHKPGTFGPILIGHEPKPMPARYEGTVTGKVMKYKVTLIETKEVIGEFTVTLGGGSRLHRCY